MKKFLSALTALSIIFALTTPAFANSTDNEPIDLTLNCVSVINDDIEFPLNAEMVFDENTIHFSESDCYECEYEVDKSLLQSEIILTAKNENSDFSLSLTDENAVILNRQSENGKISIDEFQFDKYYQFRLTIDGNTYAGEFGAIFETCNVIYIDIDYVLINEYSNLTRANQSFAHEVENNNTYMVSDIVSSGRTIVGTPSSVNDVDFYRIYLNYPDLYNSHYANGTLDITLSSRASSINAYVIKLYILENGQLLMKDISLNATGKCRYTRYLNTYGYRDFYISVTPVSAAVDPNTEYYLNVNYTGAYTFYSQKQSKIGNLETWNTQFLDELTCIYDNYTEPFITVNNTGDTDCMSEGCAIASYAMALRNVNATITGKDFRTGFTGNLYADPFTTMLANINNNGTSLENFEENTLILSEDPCYTYRATLISNFKINGNTLYSHCYDLELSNSVDLETALDYILEHNGNYGAIVTFTNPYYGTTHYITFTGKDDSQTNLIDKYTVFDPSGTTFAHAKGLKFRNCITYTTIGASHMELDYAVAIHYFNRNSQPFTIS